MLIINYSHVLAASHVAAIERLTGRAVSRVIEVPTHFDESQPFAGQARELVDAVGLTPVQWQTESLLFVLPSYNFAAALVLAELHGRTGYFPAVLRLRPVAGSATPEFEVAEILNLQSVREKARAGRRAERSRGGE